MKLRIWIACWLSILLGSYALATEQVIKEETTPPTAEGPLTVEQIPSLNSLDKPAVAAPAPMPAAPSPAPTMNPPAPANIAPTQPSPIEQPMAEPATPATPQQPAQEAKPMAQNDSDDNDGLIT